MTDVEFVGKLSLLWTLHWISNFFAQFHWVSSFVFAKEIELFLHSFSWPTAVCRCARYRLSNFNEFTLKYLKSLFENLALFFDGLFPICPPLSEIVSHWNVSDGLMMSRGSYKMDESSLSLEHIVIGTNCWPIFQSDRSSDWKERAVPFNPFWKTSQTQNSIDHLTIIKIKNRFYPFIQFVSCGYQILKNQF